MLINLTEHSKQNIEILNTAFGPACYESEASSSIDDDVSPVESLTRLFLVRNEASKEGDLMEELERLEKEQGIQCFCTAVNLITLEKQRFSFWIHHIKYAELA